MGSSSVAIWVRAPDSGATVTDMVGTSAGPHSGTALPTMSGTPSEDHAWTRLPVAGVPKNTEDNLADFVLVSTSGGLVGGVQSSLGAPNPASTASPVQRNETLRSDLLDSEAGDPTVEPNRTVSAQTLTVRRTIRNNSPGTVSGMRLVITSLSQPNGPPRPGIGAQPATRAHLRVVNPDTETTEVPVSGLGLITVHNLSVSSPSAVPPGGGIATTLAVPLPSCGLALGESVSVSVTFAVDRPGSYWFGYDVQALDVAPCRAGLDNRPAYLSPALHRATKAAGDSGDLR
jgi:hypothetical protein